MRPSDFRPLILAAATVLLAGCGSDDNPAAPRPPAAFTVDAGVQALWHMDEGTGQTLANSAGPVRTLYLGADATVETADPDWSSPGANGAGAALDFDDGESEYARAVDGFTFPGDQFTVEFMVKTPNSSNMRIVFATGNVAIHIWIQPTGNVQFDVGDGSNWGVSAVSSATVADGAWHYVACTYDHTASRVYVDGVLSATTAQVLNIADPGVVFVGGRPSGTFLSGSMDEMRVSLVARTAGEIDAFQKSR